jgi:hypothetical protein
MLASAAASGYLWQASAQAGESLMSQTPPIPKPGESFTCAACGRESIAKMQTLMDGWRSLGEAIVCAFCKAPVGAPLPRPSSPADQGTLPDAASTAALNRLASFLDTTPEAAPEFKDKDRGHFCKDCRHYFKHPFYSRCLFHDKPVEPMDDCHDFALRPAAAADAAAEPGA